MAVVKKKVLKSKAKPKKGVRPIRKPVTKVKKLVAKKVTKSKKAVKINSAVKKAIPKKKPTPKKVSIVKTNVKIKKSVVRKTPTVKKRATLAAIVVKRPKPATVISKKTEPKIGEVTHYYAQIGVAVIQLDQKPLRVGDTIHIKGHTTDFTQEVESMEVDHKSVTQVKSGELFGMKVTQHVRVGDMVYKG